MQATTEESVVAIQLSHQGLLPHRSEYEDGNDTFDEGDRNQDGKFDREDSIFALAAGHCESE